MPDKKSASQPKSGQVVPADDTSDLQEESQPSQFVTPTVVQILVEKNDVKDVEILLKAELEYNKKRLEIIRDHRASDPDAIEERNVSRFRRIQYGALLLLLALITPSIAYVSLGAAAIYGVIATMIVAGVLLNGRDRSQDVSFMTELLKLALGRKNDES